MLIIASVAISAGRRSTVTANPLISPIPVPAASAKSAARPTGSPALVASTTPSTEASASTAPTARSIPATRITKACPIATTATMVEANSRFSMLIREKNTGEAKLSSRPPIRITPSRPRLWIASNTRLLPSVRAGAGCSACGI